MAAIRRLNPVVFAAAAADIPPAACGAFFRFFLAPLEECGGAFVSEKHANFIVNSGFATAENVTALIDEIKARVFAVFGVELKEEIIYLGDFN